MIVANWHPPDGSDYTMCGTSGWAGYGMTAHNFENNFAKKRVQIYLS